MKTMQETAIEKPRIIVSLTSYPQRICLVSQAVDSILRQTMKPDRIVLWLATEQFPQREQDLPERLLEYVQKGSLELQWCSNLKPHTKYFYAFQMYGDDIVITVDDDIIYPEYLIEKLYASYLKFPSAVSCGRVNYIPVLHGKSPSYRFWPKETDALIGKPSDQLLATGVGGVLYPPHLFGDLIFDKDVIQATCLNADDLWLKLMELHYHIPVVLAMKHYHLSVIGGSQATSLYNSNGKKGQNDVQFQKLIQWYDGEFGEGAFRNALSGKTGSSFFAETNDYRKHVKSYLKNKFSKHS